MDAYEGECMSYPYGKREKLTILWEDACKTSNVKVVKAKVVFEGSPKHVAEQNARWLMQKEFIDAFSLALICGKVDFTLFGAIYRKMRDAQNFEQKARTHVSEDSRI